ncbi:hypothetical protein TEA_010310 [Camellia sinensis var. sinensis]|uniref:Sugar phosphate transporter domain-containing protein n=1 Tax=Camellia sinensis var. sinensis TaxID=542762 RepID=A0A4S4DFI1_CAMSN|nr:hypothetical protein TEA_010310 [Camellia sinensis var. sinensis]
MWKRFTCNSVRRENGKPCKGLQLPSPRQMKRVNLSRFYKSLAFGQELGREFRELEGELQEEKKRVESVHLFAALSYGIASMAMVFINKAVLMQYASSMTLLTLQQLATTMLIYCGRVMGYTKAKGVNVETAKKLILVSLFYNANVAFALASLKGVNIPMYIAIKRLTPLAVLIAGFFSGKGRPSTQVILSVVLTAAGVMIAALGDFSFDLVGYSMAFTSVFFQTMYLVLVEKSGAEDGLSSVEIMFYNSFLSLPFLVFLIIATGEFPDSLSLLFAKAQTFLVRTIPPKEVPHIYTATCCFIGPSLTMSMILTEGSNIVKTILAAQLSYLLSIGNVSHS